ncbi:hypothetical protein KAW65_05325 [candidate division WOR-3 bacterium]|nr:hypothetical protein [candidate division WOR-3 bacterium]
MGFKNHHFEIIISCFLFSVFCPLSSLAVEGLEPVPEFELKPPEVKEESLKIGDPDSFYIFSVSPHIGKNELGKLTELKISWHPKINNSFDFNFLNIDDRYSIGCGAGIRGIGINSIVELEGEAKRYKIQEKWQNLYLINSSVALYKKNMLLKTLFSSYYEDKLLWDAGLLFGRTIAQQLFMGLGISVPKIAPFIKINWLLNNALSINILHRSKTVTRTLENVYMNQPYVMLNPDLELETFKSLSQIKFIFNNLTIGITHKEIENIIFWYQFGTHVEPINDKKLHEWEGSVNLKWQKIKSEMSFKYKHLKTSRLTPKCILNTFLPTILFINTLEIPLSQDIGIGFGSKYTLQRTVYSSIYAGYPARGPILFDYWLFSFSISKKIKNLRFWLKVNNLTNTKYEIIKGVDGPGTSIEGGFKIQ